MADQVFINHQAYEDRHTDRLEAEHLGQTALMRDGSIIGLFDNLFEAAKHGGAGTESQSPWSQRRRGTPGKPIWPKLVTNWSHGRCLPAGMTAGQSTLSTEAAWLR